jgi:hypothetical protein
MTKNFDIFIEKLINSFEELPSHPPYGFWISPGGKIYSVGHMMHGFVAENILDFFEPKLGKEYRDSNNNVFDKKDFLMKKGYVRLTRDYDTIGLIYVDVFYYDSSKRKYVPVNISQIAKKTIKDIGAFYKRDIKYLNK